MHKCRGCRSVEMTTVFDLGVQPWCNDFLPLDRVGKEEKYPLRLVHCDSCSLLQLDHTVPKEVMFADHQYLSGMTQTLKDHFFSVAIETLKQLPNVAHDTLVVDIGGNDGTQLLQYVRAGLSSSQVLNIEPAKRVAAVAEQAGIETIKEFFNNDCAQTHFLGRNASIINASGVFFHLEELHSAIRGIKHMLADDGIFVVQFMYAGAMVDGNNFDTIYHEHLCYYTLQSLENLLKPYGLKVFDAHLTDIHSGSIVAKICHDDSLYEITPRYLKTKANDQKYTLEEFQKFAAFAESKKNVLKEMLVDLKTFEKAKIYAYGAPAKGNTLLNYFDIDSSLIDKAVEINDMKIGNFLPQSHIPIERETQDDLPDYYLLLSHNFADEILERNRENIENGLKFIIPFPEAKIVGKEYFDER
ncbi:MAG TPA: class I SAM-dependent methyltransferase [Patescibacteria group bacterium]|nr:class I SAM-dependent methyltransferase [Patescibacteria group bacterium]